jgi:hypothetical protein
MTEKKGLFASIFGNKDSCCCGPKIVPKTDVQKTDDKKTESCGCSCCGPKIVPKTDVQKSEDEKK